MKKNVIKNMIKICREDIARQTQEKFLVCRIRKIEICKISQNGKELSSNTYITGITTVAVNDNFCKEIFSLSGAHCQSGADLLAYSLGN